jgi:hypothetical protein
MSRKTYRKNKKSYKKKKYLRKSKKGGRRTPESFYFHVKSQKYPYPPVPPYLSSRIRANIPAPAPAPAPAPITIENLPPAQPLAPIGRPQTRIPIYANSPRTHTSLDVLRLLGMTNTNDTNIPFFPNRRIQDR